MWILQFLPSWIFALTGFISVAVYLVTKTTNILPYQKLLEYGSIFVLGFSVYMVGAIHNNDTWLAKVRELEAKLQVAEAESREANTKIETKVVTKTQVIKQRAQETVQYIDREVVRYDTSCVIPPEFISAHNKAATK